MPDGLRLVIVPDPAEALRDALRRRSRARRRYETAKREPPTPDESAEDRALRLEQLRAEADDADTAMRRLHPNAPDVPPAPGVGSPATTPPLAPGTSN